MRSSSTAETTVRKSLRQQGEEVIPIGARGVHWPGGRDLVLAWSGAAFPALAVVAGLAAVLGQEAGGLFRPVLHELFGGVDPVAELGVFDPALHDVKEEVYDACAVVGLLADDFRDGGRLPHHDCFCNGHICFVHECYYVGWSGGCQEGNFTTEDTEMGEELGEW